MLYDFSRYAWFFVEPANLLLLLLVLGTIGLWFGWRHARALVSFAVLMLLAFTVLPVGGWLFTPLENRFPQPPLPQHVDGIILLGGAVNLPVTRAHGDLGLSQVGERIVAALLLAHRYPTAPVLLSGGDPSVVPQGLTEAEVMRRVLIGAGLDEHRLLIDDRSRNTWENAVNSKRVAAPQEGQVWLLVTSAFHMPRAVGCFRQVGFDALPYPVDYHTGDGKDGFGFSFLGGFGLFDLAWHEWLGLAAYRLLGRSDAFFPAPLAATSSSSTP
jgi:uncharacterized SAM-binding protein YcdF (DUF218 family)